MVLLGLIGFSSEQTTVYHNAVIRSIRVSPTFVQANQHLYKLIITCTLRICFCNHHVRADAIHNVINTITKATGTNVTRLT